MYLEAATQRGSRTHTGGDSRPNWGTFFPRKVQEIVARDEPTEMDLFIVRTRLYQAELDPAGAEETGRLRTWLARHD